MTKKTRRSSRGFTLLELLTVVFIISTLASIMIPTVKRAMWKAQATVCATNVRNMATALQVYSNDYDGLYPDDLNKLSPKYVRILPTCPSAGTVTYAAGYSTTSDSQSFTLSCKGKNHELVGYGQDEPYYDLNTGLNPR